MVSVKMSITGYRQDYFQIEFTNDGDQVPPAMREKIFEPFYRLKETINRPGTGIGLTLSRSLATLHKGELYLQDSADDTNTFVVCLPIHQILTTNGKEKPGTG
jgi:signal transduction histidine kinase